VEICTCVERPPEMPIFLPIKVTMPSMVLLSSYAVSVFNGVCDQRCARISVKPAATSMVNKVDKIRLKSTLTAATSFRWRLGSRTERLEESSASSGQQNNKTLPVLKVTSLLGQIQQFHDEAAMIGRGFKAKPPTKLKEWFFSLLCLSSDKNNKDQQVTNRRKQPFFFLFELLGSGLLTCFALPFSSWAFFEFILEFSIFVRLLRRKSAWCHRGRYFVKFCRGSRITETATRHDTSFKLITFTLSVTNIIEVVEGPENVLSARGSTVQPNHVLILRTHNIDKITRDHANARGPEIMAPHYDHSSPTGSLGAWVKLRWVLYAQSCTWNIRKYSSRRLWAYCVWHTHPFPCYCHTIKPITLMA